MTTTVSVTVKVTHTFDRQRVEDLLICAFEGGSNYWIDEVRPRFADDAGDIYTAAFNRGIYVKVAAERGDPNSGKEFFLGQTTIRSGLQAMADKSPGHFADFLSENDDATTGDVWLQYCLFGEIVYG